jgi:hypothetical protein
MTTTAPRTTPTMITAALVRPARCSRSARASARFACSRSALLGFGGFLAHRGGGTRGPRPAWPLNGRHFGPPNRQFHDKLLRLYGSFGSSIGTSRVNACSAPSMRQSDTRVGAQFSQRVAAVGGDLGAARSLTALCSQPRRQSAAASVSPAAARSAALGCARRSARRALASSRRASAAGARPARSASSPVTRDTAACVSSRCCAPGSLSFEAITCARLPLRLIT